MLALDLGTCLQPLPSLYLELSSLLMALWDVFLSTNKTLCSELHVVISVRNHYIQYIVFPNEFWIDSYWPHPFLKSLTYHNTEISHLHTYCPAISYLRSLGWGSPHCHAESCPKGLHWWLAYKQTELETCNILCKTTNCYTKTIVHYKLSGMFPLKCVTHTHTSTPSAQGFLSPVHPQWPVII